MSEPGIILLMLVSWGLAFASLIVAIGSRNRQASLQHQIDLLWRRLREMSAPPAKAPQPVATVAPTVTPTPTKPVEPEVTPAPAPPVEEEVVLEPEASVEPEVEPVTFVASAAQAEPVEPVSASPAFTPVTTGPFNLESDDEPRAGFEEKLGARVFVWIGGIALLLAGLFLVKYSAEKGWLSEGVRVLLATVFGFAMVSGGQWMHGKSQRIAAALCGAGVAVLFGSLMAAVTLYALVPPMIGFVLMVVLTAGAVALSLRHGPFVALLALVGGFVTPAVIGKGIPPAGPTLTFLLLLEIAMTAVTRRRGWVSISALVLAASMVWALLFAVFGFEDASRPWVAAFVIGSVAVYVVSAAAAREEARSPWWLAVSATLSGIALMGLLVVIGGFSPLEFTMLAVLGAGGIVLARIDARYLPLPWIAGAAGAALLFAATWRADEPGRFVWIVTMYAVLYALGGYACAWKRAQATAWASVSAVAGAVYLLVARFGLDGAIAPAWWTVATGAGAAYVGMTAAMLRRDRATAGPIALGAAAMATLAVAWGLDKQWMPAAWMGLALAATLIVEWQRIGLLRIAIAWLIGFACAVLIVPGPFAADIGERLIFNGLLAQYGLPTLGAALIAWRLERAGEQRIAPMVQAVAVLLGVATVSLLIRHGFHRDLSWHGVRLFEWATYATAWIGGAIGLMWIGVRRGRPVIERIGLGLCVAGVAACVFGAGVIDNPAWRGESVGALPVLNGLLYVFGLPAMLCVTAAGVMHRLGRKETVIPLAVTAIMIGFALVGLQVRHGFHVDATGRMAHGKLGLIEFGTYAIAWQIMGLAMSALGQRVARTILPRAGQVIGCAGLATLAIGPVLVVNPLWFDAPVGETLIFNWLLYLYALPAALCVASAVMWRAEKPVAIVQGVASLVLLFVLISLEVRQGFHGATLMSDVTTNAEMYSYSLAWVVYGALLLVLGIARRSATLRYASASVMLLSVGKVFVFDMAHLEDLYRVLSFLGLGACLLVLGYLYQRFVFTTTKLVTGGTNH